MELVRDGILQVPLFHGTSAVFESSLRRFGLGGKNPIGEMRVLDLFKEVVPLCERYLAQDEAWKMCSIYAYDIVQGKASGGNWRYGAVYLTPSKGRAVNHARNNWYGSELLSITATLVRRIELRALPEYQDLAMGYAAAFNLLTMEHRPLLVEADSVPLSILRGEDGKSARVVLQKAAAFRDYFLDEDASFAFGFELTGILLPDRFAVVHL
jgi:hypothetical protein